MSEIRNLVVVESPAKAKTIKKYLGPDFHVLASYGHVRDLRPKKGAVEPDNHFHMHYELIEKNKKHLDAIISEMKKSDALYLATDPDREGEAIAWHISETLKAKKALAKKPVHRVVFHEITKTAVRDAVHNPRELSTDLINAQQARRALDYLVGFILSPLLWKKIRRGLSAGRVQSPALRMIVEREEEIEKFESQEYWTIEALLNAHNQNFNAKLVQYNQEKMTQFSVVNEEQATQIKQAIIKDCKQKMTVLKVEKKQRIRNPAAPFITSTLQQESIRKLGFTAQRTMRTAQQLYEAGLITYMRTDSVNLANEAVTEIRKVIEKRYGKDFLPKEAKIYKTKSKNAQEAHEAIRPTNASEAPENLKDKLTPEQFKLYQLIWKRTVACQMIHATLDTVSIQFAAGKVAEFRSTGSVIAHPGFMSVYLEGKDDEKNDDDEGRILPPLKEGDIVDLIDIINEQHFTEPPPRYTEASLVKALEEFGIGRPSTYATIISTLQTREYVLLEQKRFYPTDVGRIVNKFLTQYFTQYVDYDFTAKLEDELDAVSRGENAWIDLLDQFWQPFNQLVININSQVDRKDVTHETLDEQCPKCGKQLAILLGKRGRFIGCSGYPDCDYTRNLEETHEEAQAQENIIQDRTCPKCNSALMIRRGRFGQFIGCTGYPNCKYIEPITKPKDTEITCPTCKEGTMLERKSRYGKLFYACSRYPDCQYAVWNPPIAEECPKCHWPILTAKTTKRRGHEKVCPQKECGYATPDETKKEE